MMYANKMALAVKASGKVLREAKNGEDTVVFIPFGNEYSLLLKNLNSVRAKVRIWIDGTDVTDGTELVVNANSSMDLERFIKDGNMAAGNKFKFIERTAGVSAHRGNKIDDGLIRVEFEFERPPQPIQNWYSGNYPFTRSVFGNSGGVQGSTGDWVSKGIGSTSSLGSYSDTSGNTREIKCSYNGGAAAAASDQGETAFLNQAEMGREVTSYASETPMGRRVKSSAAPRHETDVGVTVAGGVSEQKFRDVAWFPTDGVKHVMVMQVLGEVEGRVVEQPVTVSTKPTCSSCGKVNKATSRFCSECGTGLQLV